MMERKNKKMKDGKKGKGGRKSRIKKNQRKDDKHGIREINYERMKI